MTSKLELRQNAQFNRCGLSERWMTFNISNCTKTDCYRRPHWRERTLPSTKFTALVVKDLSWRTSLWFCYTDSVTRWSSDGALDSWSRGRGFDSDCGIIRQQHWTSCSHLMCLCSPSSISWYLARAFLLKAPYCWQRHGVQWTRGYCRAVLRWFSNCIEPRYKSSALPLLTVTMVGVILSRYSFALLKSLHGENVTAAVSLGGSFYTA